MKFRILSLTALHVVVCCLAGQCAAQDRQPPQGSLPPDVDETAPAATPPTFPQRAPDSGSFGTFEESLLGSIDLQVARRFYAGPDDGCIRGLTGVLEARLTQAISSSRGVAGAAAGIDGFSHTDVLVDYGQRDPHATYLNLTCGIQADFSSDWHLRIGETIPLVNNNFTAETLIQLEKRL